MQRFAPTIILVFLSINSPALAGDGQSGSFASFWDTVAPVAYGRAAKSRRRPPPFPPAKERQNWATASLLFAVHGFRDQNKRRLSAAVGTM